MFIRTPNTAPLPGDVRLTAGRFERFDVGGWSADSLAFQGQWNEWTDYESGDVVVRHRALWVCVDPAADRWSMLAWPTREEDE